MGRGSHCLCGAVTKIGYSCLTPRQVKDLLSYETPLCHAVPKYMFSLGKMKHYIKRNRRTREESYTNNMHILTTNSVMPVLLFNNNHIGVELHSGAASFCAPKNNWSFSCALNQTPVLVLGLCYIRTTRGGKKIKYICCIYIFFFLWNLFACCNILFACCRALQKTFLSA